MELLEQVKKSQRISHDALDDVLLSDIEAAAGELSRAGVYPYTAEGSIIENPLIGHGGFRGERQHIHGVL